MPVRADSPFPLRFLAWAQERFPPVTGVGFFLGYAMAVLYARVLVGLALGGPEPTQGVLPFGFADVLSFFAAWSLFFVIRVLDEHKDYELDVTNHPHRVLQRGIVTLRELRTVAFAAVVFQGLVCAYRDGAFRGEGIGPVTGLWLLAMLFCALMAKEFFVGELLRPRLFLYASSHMLVMVVIYAWFAQMGAAPRPLPGAAATIALAGFFGGFTYEVARKFKAPEDERPTVDSYTKSFGPRGAAALATLLLVLCVACCVALVVLAGLADGAWGTFTAFGASVALFVATAAGFLKKPTAKNAKAVEGAAAGAIAIVMIALLARVALVRGVFWS